VSRIAIEGLTKRFGDVRAVDRVDLDIAHGDFLVLLGPSGCGKSTLLRTIAGLVDPDEGRVLLDGRDITHAPARDRDLAMVFQSYALYPHLTVERNIGFPLRARRLGRAETRTRVERVAAALDLGDLLRRRPRELSGGQRQRVALGRALVRDPGAFLMDEPLSNLDAKLRTATRAELTELHRSLGTTFVYVTHDQVEAMTMATTVALLDHGRLDQLGTPAEVYDRPASVFVAGFLGSPPMNLIDARIEARDGRPHAVAAGVDVPLDLPADGPDGARAGGAGRGREVVLGIRPEDLVVTADGRRPRTAASSPASALGTIHGTVRTLENLGSEEVAHCVVGPADGHAGPTDVTGPAGTHGTASTAVTASTAGTHGTAGTAGTHGARTPAGAVRIRVRGRRPIGLAVGDAVRLTVLAEHTHLFDRASGRRLVWSPDQHPPIVVAAAAGATTPSAPRSPVASAATAPPTQPSPARPPQPSPTPSRSTT
jgi:multiple sugar transport system ATP-binding protein